MTDNEIYQAIQHVHKRCEELDRGIEWFYKALLCELDLEGEEYDDGKKQNNTD